MGGISYDKKDAIATITFNWSASDSGPDPAIERELAKAVDDFGRDPACRVGILTGTGESFCGEWTEPEPFLAEAQRGFSHFATLYPFSNDTDKPVIAAVNGAAIGRGFELALDCDIRIASESATFAVGPVKNDRRLIYAAQVLPRLIPFGQAMRLLLSEEVITAQQGHRIGLVTGVVPAGRLLDEARALAQTMAQWGLPALIATKQIGLFWRNLMLGQSYEMARALMHANHVAQGQ